MSTETGKKTKTPAKPRKTATAAPKAKAKSKTATELPPVTMPSHEEIAILAQRFWLERGCQDGGAEHDWLRAEQELLGRAS